MKFLCSFLVICSVVALMATPLPAMMEEEEPSWYALCERTPQEIKKEWEAFDFPTQVNLFEITDRPIQEYLWDHASASEETWKSIAKCLWAPKEWPREKVFDVLQTSLAIDEDWRKKEKPESFSTDRQHHSYGLREFDHIPQIIELFGILYDQSEDTDNLFYDVVKLVRRETSHVVVRLTPHLQGKKMEPVLVHHLNPYSEPSINRGWYRNHINDLLDQVRSEG